MYRTKKSEIRAESEDKEEIVIDFARILYICKRYLNCSDKEAGHLSFRKYMDLFEQHRYFHNIEIGRMLYKDEDAKEQEAEEQETEVVYF